MNHRERFLNTMRFQSVDRIPYHPLPVGWWNETINRWYKEGLTKSMDFLKTFGYDPFIRENVNFGFCPAFEEQILKEEDHTVVLINKEGIVMRELKENAELSMPQFLEFPVKDREDFIKLLPRLQLNDEQRFPKDWGKNCEIYKYRNVPLMIKADREGGFFGPLRNLMGLENLSYTYFDDPKLIEMMIENRVELMLDILGKILIDIKIDWFIFWEDMACNHGPLLSPELFKKYMVPAYKKVTRLLRDNGVDIIFVDCDGNVEELIPLWIEAGVNGVYPMEFQSGMDVVKLRKQYGNDLLMTGGIDKRVLKYGKREIENEVNRISSIIDKGGYIPGLDHSVPPDVSFENFIYYMDYMSKVTGFRSQ